MWRILGNLTTHLLFSQNLVFWLYCLEVQLQLKFPCQGTSCHNIACWFYLYMLVSMTSLSGILPSVSAWPVGSVIDTCSFLNLESLDSIDYLESRSLLSKWQVSKFRSNNKNMYMFGEIYEQGRSRFTKRYWVQINHVICIT